VLDPDHGPGIAAAGQQRVHQEPCDPAVAIGERVDVADQPVAEHGADRGLRLALDEIEQRGHRVAQHVRARRDMARAAQVDRVVAIAGERAGGQ